MKRIVLTLLIALLTITISAQSPFSGFFKPVTANPNIKFIGSKTASSVWLIRPTVELSAMQLIWNKETKTFDATAFNSTGFGIGYQHFINNQGLPYNNYGFNLLVLFDIVPTETIDAAMSLAGTVSVFQFVNVGAGYNFGNKVPFILTAVTVKF